jgi:hypothetical protein
MPLYSVYTKRGWSYISTTMLTQCLRWAVTTLSGHVDVIPLDISVRYLRASRAMALLCANIDSDRIRLLGRRRSDKILCYLHVQAFPVLQPLASLMVRHGYFILLPNSTLG